MRKKLKILSRYLNNCPSDLEIGQDEFEFYRNSSELWDAQAGYLYNSNDNTSIIGWDNDWIVIGRHILVGDPLVINLQDQDAGVFILAHDIQSVREKIANSIIHLLKILNLIVENENDTSPDSTLKQQVKAISDLSFWDELID